ncbi:MAG: hypothetical protein ACE5JU_05115 [Candidatus Binatia bacterium]
MIIKGGATVENADVIDPVTATQIYTPEILKKSEDFYFKLLGLK